MTAYPAEFNLLLIDRPYMFKVGMFSCITMYISFLSGSEDTNTSSTVTLGSNLGNSRRISDSIANNVESLIGSNK